MSSSNSDINANEKNTDISAQENSDSNLSLHLNGLSKKRAPHLRGNNLKVQSPSDVLSPFSQKIVAERSSALKNLKPRSLTNALLGASSTKSRLCDVDSTIASGTASECEDSSEMTLKDPSVVAEGKNEETTTD